MSDKVTILYNSGDLFFPQPTPFVGMEVQNVYNGELWAKLETITLDGQITGCRFGDLVTGQRNIVERLKKNYQSLEIWQEKNGVSGRVFQKNHVEVQTIAFNEDRWVGVLPYTITLTCYPSGYFSGQFGVLDPVDTWTYSEQKDYSSSITHTVSCRGYNTSAGANNALENARTWAFGKRYLDSFVAPAFISNFTSGNVCLVSSAEDIDRFGGTYSITDTYSSDLTRSGYGILRYNTSLDSGDNKVTVTLNGSIEGCGQDLTKIRSAFQNLNKPATAALSYQKLFNKTDLNINPISNQVTEDVCNTRIEFTYVYDNDNSPDPYFDYSVTIASGDAFSASINGTIVARGDLKTKLIKSKNYAKTVNLYNLVLPFYQGSYANANLYPLNPRPISSGISITESNGQISLNAEFNNADQIDATLDTFNYTLSFLPARNRIDAQPIVGGVGTFSIVDLGYANRAELGIQGNSQININADPNAGLEAIKSKCMGLLGQYGGNVNVTLDTNTISTERFDKRKVSFNFGWSFDSPNRVSTDLSGINTLAVI